MVNPLLKVAAMFPSIARHVTEMLVETLIVEQLPILSRQFMHEQTASVLQMFDHLMQ